MTYRNRSEPGRELRLALVMNGGVSLAVWMSGVTHEIANGRRANEPNDQPSRAVWKTLLDAAETRLTVDVIAGTSAGGLNGTVLARAIAQDQELPTMKRLWLRDAALWPGRLLSSTPNPSASLLNGQYFRDAATGLLAEVPARTQPSAASSSVTLLVTATALPIRDGATDGDDQVRDSRRVYRFRSQPGVPAGWAGIDGLPSVADLSELDDVDTLALAARASASFPAAFQPVWESDRLRRQQIPRTRSGSRWLMDGGVLDNAPFEPTLDELRRRPVTEVFDRAIVYINPASGNVVKPRQVIKPGGPGIVTTVAAFAKASREPDRRLDREQLNEAIDAIGYTDTDPDKVLATIFRTPDDGEAHTAALHTAAAALMPNYRASRATVLFLAASIPASARPTEPAAATERDYPGPPAILVADTCDPADNDSWRWGLTAADRMLRWWGRALIAQDPSDERHDGLTALASAQLLVQQWGDQLEASVAPYRGQVVEWYIRAGQFFTQRNVAPLLNQLMVETARSVAPGLGTESGDRLLHTTLDLEVVSRAVAWRADSNTDVPDFDLWEITPEAPHPCDLGSTGGHPNWPAKKLYGEQWGHFGAFASERGRRWDWLWGRLDAAMIISEQVLRRAGKPTGEIQSHQAELIDSILTEELSSASDDNSEHLAWLRTEAEAMLARTGRSLWLDFVRPDLTAHDPEDPLREGNGADVPRPVGADTLPLRKNLLSLASAIPGAAVPRSWPFRVHALLDDQKTWRQHRPQGLARIGVLPFWAIGRVARGAAFGWLKKVLNGRVGREK